MGNNAVENNTEGGDKARKVLKQSGDAWADLARKTPGIGRVLAGGVKAISGGLDLDVAGVDYVVDWSSGIVTCVARSTYCNTAVDNLSKKNSAVLDAGKSVVDGRLSTSLTNIGKGVLKGDGQSVEDAAEIAVGVLIGKKGSTKTSSLVNNTRPPKVVNINTVPTTRIVTKYGPMVEQGPLPQTIANTFRSGTYTEVVTIQPTILYRVYGGTANQLGAYWTSTPPAGSVQSIIDSALNPAWGNTATNENWRLVYPDGPFKGYWGKVELE